MKNISLKIITFALLCFYPFLISAQNNALKFNGANDYIVVTNPSPIVSGDFTVELWLNASTWENGGSWNSLVSLRTGSNSNWQFLHIGGSIAIYYNNNAITIPFAITPSTNKWHHMALVRDGTNWDLYLDGILVSQQNNATAINSNNYNLNIAASGIGGGDGDFDGEMDEIRIWDDARTLSEIRANMYRELPNPSGETDLVAYYKLNETSGTSAADSKGSNTGTLTNMAGTEWIASPAFFGPKTCISFDGVNDKVSLTNLNVSTTTGENATVEFWMYWDGNDNEMPFSFNAYTLWFYNSSFGFNTFSTDIYGISSSGLSNKWIHVAAIFHNGDLTQNVLYLNGVEQNLSQLTGTPSGTEVVSATATIGGHETDIFYYFTGEIDELRIWNGSRTATDIGENMCRTLTGNETNLLAYYNMDFGRGTEVPDFSANGDDGHAAYFYSGSVLQKETSSSFTASGDPNWTDDELIGKKLFITTPGKEQERTIIDNYVGSFVVVNADFNPDISSSGDTYYIRGDDLSYEGASAFNTWLNTSSTSWSTTTNWSLGSVPTSTSNVGLYDYGNSDPLIPTEQTINNLVVGSGVSTQIDNDKSLTVDGNLFVSGALILESTSAGSGSLIVHGTATGSVTIERYIGGETSATKGWHFLSSPLANQNISTQFVDVTATPIASGVDFYRWSETEGLWINIKNEAGNYNKGSGETYFSNEETPTFNIGKGYLVAYSTNQDKTFSGSLQTTGYDISGLTNTNGKAYAGWHLLGNPFSCALDFNAGTWNKSGIAGYAQIWNESAASYKVLRTEQNIPTMNGFMVYTSSNSGSLTIPADARIHSDTNWYKASEDENMIVLLAVDNQTNTSQETIINFDPEATNYFDLEHDSYYIAGFAPMFYSIQHGSYYALNCLPELKEDMSIPLGFVKNSSTEFAIYLSEANSEYDIWLLDKKLNKDHNLTQNSTYYFTAFENDYHERFVVHFSPVGIEEPTIHIQLMQIWGSNNTIHIFNNNNLVGDIQVVNMYGQTIINTKLTGYANQQIRVSSPSGYYIVNVATKGGVVNKKVYLK